MRYFIVAGERSGDLHASQLIKAILRKDPQAAIKAWGGDMMKQAGAELLQHYKETAFMGLWEVIRNLNAIRGKLKLCQQHIASQKPDILILVDYPGFNLRVAKYAKLIGVKTCYYISPKIWAWKKGRIKQIKKYIDQMLVILPFEKAFYDNLNYPVSYVGNPLVEIVRDYQFDQGLLVQLSGEPKKKIAFLPGSRVQEVERSIQVIKDLAKTETNHHFLVAGVDNLPFEIYSPLKSLENVSVYIDKTYELLKAADAAVVTSGTATLEAALLGAKQVVVYKTSWLTYQMGKLLVKIQFFSLVNLIAGEEIVLELLQEKYNIPSVKRELDLLLHNRERREHLEQGYADIDEKLGPESASENAALAIIRMIS